MGLRASRLGFWICSPMDHLFGLNPLSLLMRCVWMKDGGVVRLAGVVHPWLRIPKHACMPLRTLTLDLVVSSIKTVSILCM